MKLRDVMEFDHVIRVVDGTWYDDVKNVYAPEVSVGTDEDGQITDDDERAMVESVTRQGWGLLSGWTGQYGYNGPIMHASEYVGGQLAQHILATPGLYCVVSVETLDDSEEPAGWVVAYRDLPESDDSPQQDTGGQYGILTFAHLSPGEIAGKAILVRPFYHVPDGSGESMKSTRSPWTVRGVVVDMFGPEMVVVRHTGTNGPWNVKAVYYPRELHQRECQCRACIPGGEGIAEHNGA